MESSPSLPTTAAAGPEGAVCPPRAPLREDSLRGIALIIAATASFSISDAAAKQLSLHLGTIQIAWFRFLVLMIVVIPWARAQPGRQRSARPGFQLLQALGLMGSTLLFVGGLQILPVAEATAMVFASPLCVTLLSRLILKERMGLRRWAVVVTGFVGVLIVMRPGTAAFQAAALLPVLAALSWAVTVVYTRRASETDSAATTLLYAAVVGFAVLTALLFTGFTVPAPADWPPLLIMGVTWCAAQWLTVAAYRSAPSSVVAPFSYGQILWASILGYLFFDHLPDGVAFAGIALILACGLYAAYQARPGSAATGGESLAANR